MIRRHSTVPLTILAAGLTLTACGSNDQPIDKARQASAGQGTQTSGQSADGSSGGPAAAPAAAGAPGGLDQVLTPPAGYYDQLFAATLARVDAPAGTALLDGATSAVLWVNFDGAALDKGFGPGESFLLCNDQAQIPPAADLSAADQDTVIHTVQQLFNSAGANLIVTATRPATGDFTTVDVGGTAADLGCPAGVSGMAAFDKGNANPNDIAFAFPAAGMTATQVADLVAHEAGHTFGLEHGDLPTDVMYNAVSAQITGFASGNVAGTNRAQNAPAMLQQALNGSAMALAGAGVVSALASGPAAVASIPGLGTLPALLAGLPGLGQLAGIGQLLPGLASGNLVSLANLVPGLAAGSPVLLAQLLPGIATILPAAGGGAPGSLQGLDKIFTIVGLAQTAGAQSPAAAAAASGAGSALGGGLIGALLGAKSGSSLLNLGQLAQLGGFASPATAVPTLTAIPDLASLLNLGSLVSAGGGGAGSIAGLLGSLTGLSQVVATNFSGADAQALQSLLKLAYSQQFLQLLAGLP